ncbi:hypothetical protein X975_04173, partial [Stegodyphus mimosarum]
MVGSDKIMLKLLECVENVKSALGTLQTLEKDGNNMFLRHVYRKQTVGWVKFLKGQHINLNKILKSLENHLSRMLGS